MVNEIGVLADYKGVIMFLTRLISGIALLALSFLLIGMGGNTLLVAIFLISEIGIFELYRVMKMEESGLGFVGYFMTGLWFFLLFLFKRNLMLGEVFILLMVAMVVISLLLFVIQYPKQSASQLFMTVFGFLYVSFMLSFVYLTRENVRHGEWLVWLIYISSWGSDTCAYVVGRLFGKRKLAPVLSPKKSIEGAVGGVVGAALLGLLYGYLMIRIKGETEAILPLFTVIGGIGSMISQIGDLAASGIKRNFDIKDYGKLIPGHGGILDRFDSMIMTAPIVFLLADYYMKYFL